MAYEISEVANLHFDKIFEAVIYVASKLPEPSQDKICSMFWFADLLHMEEYAGWLSGDIYYAKSHGPIPSLIAHIMNVAANEEAAIYHVDPKIVQASLGVIGSVIFVKRTPNLDHLSQAAVECLDRAIELHGSKSPDQLSAETRDSAWASALEGETIPSMEIIRTLSNCNVLIDHFNS